MDHPAEHLVFVGNLPFKASQDDLKDFFAPAAAVADVNVIRRGSRSLGYGFVAFANAADRDRAVEMCHKKELDGREINVEAAKPKSELPLKERKPRAKRTRKPKKADEPKQQETEDGVIVSHGDDKKGKKKRKPRNKRKSGDEEEGGDAAEGDAAAAKPRKPLRERRVPTGEPSKTTCFLANLPFALDNDGLREVFEGYKVKSATVIVRKSTGHSKGFGFLELESEEEQKRLLDDVADGKKFLSHEREIGVKVALSEPIEPDADADADAAAPDAAAAAPAGDNN